MHPEINATTAMTIQYSAKKPVILPTRFMTLHPEPGCPGPAEEYTSA